MIEETDISLAFPTGEDCVICLTVIDDDCVRTPCHHHFHQGCLDQCLRLFSKKLQLQPFLRPRCPICRASLGRPLPVDARATSGSPIEVCDCPDEGGYCHFDRCHIFESLGGFDQPGMLYVVTSNDDMLTPTTETMWILEVSIPVIVHLNFRSSAHVTHTGVAHWLFAEGWERTAVESPVVNMLTGELQFGPVYSRVSEPGTINLKGSGTCEGTYFVFVQPLEDPSCSSDQARSRFGIPEPFADALHATAAPSQLLLNEQRQACTATTHSAELNHDAISPRSEGSDGVAPRTPDESDECDSIMTPPITPEPVSPRSITSEGDGTDAETLAAARAAVTPRGVWHCSRASMTNAARSMLAKVSPRSPRSLCSNSVHLP